MVNESSADDKAPAAIRANDHKPGSEKEKTVRRRRSNKTSKLLSEEEKPSTATEVNVLNAKPKKALKTKDKLVSVPSSSESKTDSSSNEKKTSRRKKKVAEAEDPERKESKAAERKKDLKNKEKKEDVSDTSKSKSAEKKRVRNRKKNKKETTTSATSSAEEAGAALLNLLRGKKQTVRTGKISMKELMGDKKSASSSEEPAHNNVERMMQRLGGNKIDPEAILDAALAHFPQVPGFPSLSHRPDNSPYSSAFPPELFKTTMEAYMSAVHQCGGDILDGLTGGPIAAGGAGATRSRSSLHMDRERHSRLQRHPQMPWLFNMSPMFPLERSGNGFGVGGSYNGSMRQHGGPMRGGPHSGGGDFRPHNQGMPMPNFGNSPMRGGMQMNHGGQQGFRPHQMQQNSGSRHSYSNMSHHQNGSGQSQNNQKTRKPYFMPYMAPDSVQRGLVNNDLIKGNLRVNQRNYEESYVDNPAGDSELDILILGVHDRNRALHGDVVVVRVKDRKQWVVRENLYQAWRAGNLHCMEDNGQPLTIPPLPIEEEAKDEIILGGHAEVILRKGDLEKNIPVDPECRYNRATMVLIGAQMEVSRKQELCDPVEGSSTHLEDEVHNLIEQLSITKQNDRETVRVPSPVTKKPPQQQKKLGYQQQPNNNRRNNYRLLDDMSEDDWGMPDVCLQKTAEVVCIQEAKNPRAAMGQLRMMADANRNYALFSPTDSRMPRMMIPHDQLPNGFFDRPHDYAKFIFVARLVEWPATAQFARGKLERTLGLAGDIEAETEGLLITNGVDTREFSQAALGSLPITDSTTWHIEEKEYKYRRDLREETIFTIDPRTARDLDDALHIKRLDDVGNGLPGWEMGVHIADVTHFLLDQTELDKWASERCTSVYLVHKVIPMLPRILCEELCSLNSGVDRLTFSVIWKMNDDAEILEEWFGRTIIKSCVKLAYEHAQDMIENPEKEFTISELPELFSGRTPADIKEKVLYLDALAKKLNKKRVTNGALRLDQPKLRFSLDDETKLPNGVVCDERKDSNKLVEEFMLLANMAVARKIEREFPRFAVLRRHPAPKQKVLRETLELCDKIGFPMDASTSGLLSSCLRKYEGQKGIQTAIHQVLSMLMMKPMQLAEYFCTGKTDGAHQYNHYALAAPYYTHFTSPIRRYADCMVHRLLAAALGYAPLPALTVEEIAKRCEACNDKKNAAKAISEASADTFFGLFVKECGPIEERGVVVNVLDQSFDVLVFKYGVIKRVYLNKLEKDMARPAVYTEGPPKKLSLFWVGGEANAVLEQTVTLCSVVDVVLTALPEPTKYQAVIKPNPKSSTLLEMMNSKEEF